MRFDDRVVVITGAGRGMGREHALLFAKRGASVVVNNRGADAAHAVVKEIRDDSGIAVPCVADVSTADGAERPVQTALAEFGRVDIVVNNAGICELARFEDQTAETLDATMNTHFRSSWTISQAAWPHMISQGYGRIIMVISGASVFGLENSAAYCAAKGAMAGLARCLAVEGAPHGISVNAISTSGDTDMTRTALGDPQFQEWKAKNQPAWMAAPPVVWLAHEDCPSNGETFSAGGRWLSRLFTAESRGYVVPGEYTPETLKDHFDEVCDEEGYVVHRSVQDYALHLAEKLGSGSIGDWGRVTATSTADN